MTTRTFAGHPLAYAKVAGLLYLVIIVLGIFSEVVVRGELIVPGDATTTAANIRASEGLFRAGFAGDAIVSLSDVAVAVLFYLFLAPVHKPLALIAAAFRLTQTAILGLNLLHHHLAISAEALRCSWRPSTHGFYRLSTRWRSWEKHPSACGCS